MLTLGNMQQHVHNTQFSVPRSLVKQYFREFSPKKAQYGFKCTGKEARILFEVMALINETLGAPFDQGGLGYVCGSPATWWIELQNRNGGNYTRSEFILYINDEQAYQAMFHALDRLT